MVNNTLKLAPVRVAHAILALMVGLGGPMAAGCTKGQEGDLNNRTNDFGMDDNCLWVRGTIDVGTNCPGLYPCPEGSPSGQCQCPQTGVKVGLSDASMVIGEGHPPSFIVFQQVLSNDIRKQFSVFSEDATQLDAFVCLHQEAPGDLTGEICGVSAAEVLPWHKYAWLVNEDQTRVYYFHHTSGWTSYDNPLRRDMRGRTWREDQEDKGSTMTMDELLARLEASRGRNPIRPATDHVLTRDASSSATPWRGAGWCGPLE